MSNHISFVCVWINFMPPFSSVLRNCIYSPFELGLWGGGVLGRGDVKSMCVNIVLILCVLQVVKTVFNFIPM
jgi:hypothetical protein